MNKNPFDAMGRPIITIDPAVLLINKLYNNLSLIESHKIVKKISEQLEKNESNVAFNLCKQLLGNDVTLHYRLVATLLTFVDMNAPQIRGGRGMENLNEG